MKSLKLRVSSTDIKNGEKSNPQACAIARSLKRSKTKLKSVSVFHSICIVKKTEKGKVQNYRAYLPSEAQVFVKSFDHGLAVTPFSFSLDFKKVSNKEATASLYNN
jgi:hypothetical protein